MTFLALIGHLANFAAPALGLALLLWGFSRIGARRPARWPARKELMVQFALGLGVLLLGLMVFGRDAKMLTYSALVLAQGSLAWWNRR
jgi:hypothetical protein